MANTTTPYKLYFYQIVVFLFVVPVGLLYKKIIIIIRRRRIHTC